MYYDDSVIEDSTVPKLLRHLLPLLCLLSMTAMLDRLNLGYVAPAMDPALPLGTDQLRLANEAYFAGFALACLPATWLMARLGPRIWITGIVIAWAVIAMLHALVWNFTSLWILRLVLGVCEASLMPAMVFYLAAWMPETHRGKAIGVLVAAASVMPLLGEQATNLLMFLGQLLGIGDWRLLFVVEGLPALWIGLHVRDALPPSLAQTVWLTPPERHWLLNQLRDDTLPLPHRRFPEGLCSTAMWKLAAVRAAVAAVAGSLGMWVPIAMQQRGYLPPGIGAIIIAVATVVGAGVAGAAGFRWRDCKHWRRALMTLLVVAGLCLALAACFSSAVLAVLMLALVACVAPAILALTWTLAPSLLGGAAAAAGFGIIAALGALGDVVASELAVQWRDPPTRCLILAAACITAALLVRGVAGQRVAPATPAASSQPV